MPAGRQGSSYSTRVNGFAWTDFYERFGGGAFLNQMRSLATQDYDYVLIDSRTGVSDTSGICTIQLPDTLIVCFTLNNQNVEGAAGVAATVTAKRSDVRVLPVPMRIENSEKDRLELRRTRARRRFTEVLGNIDRTSDPERYWADSEVLYVPYYAYEEILAPFADPVGSPLTMLAAAERLTGRLTGGAVAHSVRISDSRRVEVLAAYAGTPIPQTPSAIAGGYVYLSHVRADSDHASRVYEELARALGSERVVSDVLAPGVDWAQAVGDAVRSSAVVVVLIGPDWSRAAGEPGAFVRHELAAALDAPEVRVIPALVGGAKLPEEADLPRELAPIVRRQAIALTDSRWMYDMGRLRATIELAIAGAGAPPTAASAEARPYAPSQASDEVIESVLRGARRSIFVTLLEQEPFAFGSLIASVPAVLVLLHIISIDVVELAAVMVAVNTLVSFGLRIAVAPSPEVHVQQEVRRAG